MSRPRDLDDLRERLRAILPELRQRYPISYLGIFGSWARGEQRPDSDVDLLVDFDGGLTGWGEVDLEIELGDRLGVTVDLVPRKLLRPRVGDRILREARAL